MEDDLHKRLKLELERIEYFKNKKSAQQSFEIWSSNTIEKVGRAFGYRISVTKQKLGNIWNWLVN